MAYSQDTRQLARTEEALITLFCLVDDAYCAHINPKGQRYGSLKRLSDSEVLALALFQQLRGVESERSFLRDVARFFSHLFPGVLGLWPSSLHRRLRKLRCFLEPLRRIVLPELVGDPETLIVDSTLLSVLHPRQVGQSAGFEGAAWVRWGSFSVYGVKLHVICATNRVPISYELTPANAADIGLVEELLVKADLGEEVARGLLGDLAYRSQELEEDLAKLGIALVSGEASARRPGVRQSRWRSAFRASSGSSVSGRPWPPPWWGSGNQDRSEDDGLHLRLLDQPLVGASSSEDQGSVGMNLATHI